MKNGRFIGPRSIRNSVENSIYASQSLLRVGNPRANFATAYVYAGTAHQSFASLRASHPVEKASTKDGQEDSFRRGRNRPLPDPRSLIFDCSRAGACAASARGNPQRACLWIKVKNPDSPAIMRHRELRLSR
jgi:hypothetical protein